MDRSYISITATDVGSTSDNELYGKLARNLPFEVDPLQRSAWEYQIQHLRELAAELPTARFFVEFLIPRMGRRADLIVVDRGVVFVVEYKVGTSRLDQSSLNQVYGYGLDLKHFHETSHHRSIVPILVPTGMTDEGGVALGWDEDGLAHPICVCPSDLASIIAKLADQIAAPALNPIEWSAGRYRPTPTIVEAAQALYGGHNVDEISRSEAGAENLTRTADYVARAIETAKEQRQKIICFITGVPGSGKTLAGLNLACARQRAHSDEHAVFLSGNGPLVEVLREALTLDAVSRANETGQKSSKTLEYRRASSFIQNIHHFRDEALTSSQAPVERVAIFDEAQRAWDLEQASKFMQQKRGRFDFAMSEPEFLLSVMDRHSDWCAITCLVGSGQEINTGEGGISEWLSAIERSFPHWRIHLSPSLRDAPLSAPNIERSEALHLATSIRSFRAEKLSDFVGHVIDGDAAAAARVNSELGDYPLFVTRDLDQARQWLRSRRRGAERAGLLASSNAARLKPHGIFVKAKIEPAKWFLGAPDDVRSSDALEDAATEFDVQGLELDWACLCWDANLRWSEAWEAHQFRGSRWETINDPARRVYLANSYRVLMTRARQGLVVFVPEGSAIDATRPPEYYDGTYQFLLDCGFTVLPSVSE